MCMCTCMFVNATTIQEKILMSGNDIIKKMATLLTKDCFSHGKGLSINHHACSMRVVDFKLIIRNYKPRFPHDVFLYHMSLAEMGDFF
uniref:SFRICE_019688 n=1 Tax=Spodoptera frugiperda TaxID=7108 RepID=A0A2H1W808_SPOFR